MDGKSIITDMLYKGYIVKEAILNDNLVFSRSKDGKELAIEYKVYDDGNGDTFGYHYMGTPHDSKYLVTFEPDMTTMGSVKLKNGNRIDISQAINNTLVRDIDSIRIIYSSSTRKITLPTHITEILNADKMDTSNITDMSSMFYWLEYIQKDLDLSGWDVGNVTDMSDIFSVCETIETLDLSGWDVSNVTDMSSMFFGCHNLMEIKGISNWNTHSVKNMECMFYGCVQNFDSLDLSGWDVSNVTDMSGMFMSYVVAEENKLKRLNLSGWDMSNVTDIAAMFQLCGNLSELILPDYFVTNKMTDLSGLFSQCLISSEDVSRWIQTWDTSNVTDMTSMFAGCTRLTTLDLSCFNTLYVTDMGSMFSRCSSLTSINLSTWNTGSVINMSNMFSYCTSLVSLDLSNFTTHNVTNMNSMFRGCGSLTTLDASNFNTENVTDCAGMLASGIYDGNWAIVSSNIDFKYNGHNYQHWDLGETETGYGGTFPWNESRE